MKRYEMRRAWLVSAEGLKAYIQAKKEAQQWADRDGREVGIELLDFPYRFYTFGLPNPENRYGHELTCEVVSPTRRIK